MRMPKYEVFQGDSGAQHDWTPRWYWRLKGGNGETVCVSEGFPSKGNAKRACKRARVLSRFAVIREV